MCLSLNLQFQEKIIKTKTTKKYYLHCTKDQLSLCLPSAAWQTEAESSALVTFHGQVKTLLRLRWGQLPGPSQTPQSWGVHSESSRAAPTREIKRDHKWTLTELLPPTAQTMTNKPDLWGGSIPGSCAKHQENIWILREYHEWLGFEQQCDQTSLVAGHDHGSDLPQPGGSNIDGDFDFQTSS